MVKLILKKPEDEKKFSIEEPNLLREIFSFTEPPKKVFDKVPAKMREGHEIWITDTTFRDGQQARPPYAPEQIRDIYVLLSKLDNGMGIIKQSEFFLYSKKDKRAVELCLEQGLKFPEITGWIRAVPADFRYVKEMELKETGILTSISDYHIYKKLNLNRENFIEKYMQVVDAALENGVLPRCHLEDITKADFYGTVIPFVNVLMKRAEETKVPIKIRLCDTMGYGDSDPYAALPIGIPKIIDILIKECGLKPEQLEWHGHNDFHAATVNAKTAWLYGCSAANCTLIGVGERTGNPSLEGMIINILQLIDLKKLHISSEKSKGVNTYVIKEIADYLKTTGMIIPHNHPFVGEDCNTTNAGIHADGLMKDPEIYQIFDMSLVGRILKMNVTDKSGAAGITEWINENIHFDYPNYKVNKDHPGVKMINDLVAKEYEEGRVTSMSEEEMDNLSRLYLPEAFISDFERMQENASKYAKNLLEDFVSKNINGRDEIEWTRSMIDFVDKTKLIQATYVTDINGKLTHLIPDSEKAYLYKNVKIGGDLSDRDWYRFVIKDGKTYSTEIFRSNMTNIPCVTVATPIKDKSREIIGVYEIDLDFKHLAKVVESDLQKSK